MDGFLWEHLFYGLRDQYVQFDILVFTSVIWVSFSVASSSKLSSLRFPLAHYQIYKCNRIVVGSTGCFTMNDTKVIVHCLD